MIHFIPVLLMNIIVWLMNLLSTIGLLLLNQILLLLSTTGVLLLNQILLLLSTTGVFLLNQILLLLSATGVLLLNQILLLLSIGFWLLNRVAFLLNQILLFLNIVGLQLLNNIILLLNQMLLLLNEIGLPFLNILLKFVRLIIFSPFTVFNGTLESIQRYEELKGCRQKLHLEDHNVVAILSSLFSTQLIIWYYPAYEEIVNYTSEGIFNFCLNRILVFIMVTCAISPYMSSFIPDIIPNIQFKIVGQYKFSLHQIMGLICGYFIGTWCLSNKHWIVVNPVYFLIIGLAEYVPNKVAFGCIFICEIVVFDFIWVFATNLFFEALKLLIPFFEWTDILVPGVLTALLSHFENSLGKDTKIYFYVALVACILNPAICGLLIYILEHCDPLLLYLVPIGFAVFIGLIFLKDRLSAMFYRTKKMCAQKSSDKMNIEATNTEMGNDK